MSNDSHSPPSPKGYPIVGHAAHFARSPFSFLNRATAECGDLYRIELLGFDIYIVASAELMKQVLVTDIDAFSKADDFDRAFGEGLLATEGEQWSRQRNILQPSFHRDQISGYADDIVRATQRRLATWNPGEIRNIESEMQDLTIEILFTTLFGRDLAPDEGQELRDASDGLNKWFVPTSFLLPRWVPTPARREFADSKDRLRTEVQRILSEYDTEGIGRPGTMTFEGSSQKAVPTEDVEGLQNGTFLSKLTEARQAAGEDHLSGKEIEDQMLTMIFAGYETTAATLGFAWYALATNSDIRASFHEELDTVLGGDPPTKGDIPNLELTNQIVTETLRLFPPLHTLPRQTIRDVDMSGYRLPAHEEVHLSVISVHRDGQYYDDPLEFRPSRWTPEFEEELDEYAYMPFGGGRRTCIGREFARLEVILALATIGQEFAFEWAGEGTDITIEPEMTTKTKNGLPMTLCRR